MSGEKIPSVFKDDPPDNGKGQPTEEKTGRKNEQDIAPLEIKHGIEEVSEVSASPMAHLVSSNLNLAFLSHQSFSSPFIEILLRFNAKHGSAGTELPSEHVHNRRVIRFGR